MGQAFSSCVPCVGNDHDNDAALTINEAEMENGYLKPMEPEQPQWREKIRYNFLMKNVAKINFSMISPHFR